MINLNENSSGDHYRISSAGLLLMSIASMLIYISLTLLLARYVHEASFISLFQHGITYPVQLLTGVIFGLIAAGIIFRLMFQTALSGILKDYVIVNLLSGMHLSRFDRTQVSVFAGIGEELFFRGALQPVIGIWLTSLLFVALHGYFKFRSWKHIVFGLLMFLLSIGLGVLYERAGLVAAMTAHVVYDYVMFGVVFRTTGKKTIQE